MYFIIQTGEYFCIKCYFRAILEIDVTKNRIFWGISLVKLKCEIHSPGNVLLIIDYCINSLSLYQFRDV